MIAGTLHKRRYTGTNNSKKKAYDWIVQQRISEPDVSTYFAVVKGLSLDSGFNEVNRKKLYHGSYLILLCRNLSLRMLTSTGQEGIGHFLEVRSTFSQTLMKKFVTEKYQSVPQNMFLVVGRMAVFEAKRK